jgi:hypothetical protein
LKPGESQIIIVSSIVDPGKVERSILTGQIYLVSDYMKGLIFTLFNSDEYSIGPMCLKSPVLMIPILEPENQWIEVLFPAPVPPTSNTISYPLIVSVASFVYFIKILRVSKSTVTISFNNSYKIFLIYS